jgi:GNAT superfamily N-acetyltransferase
MIRRAEVGDAGALAVVHVASWRAAYEGLVPDGVIAELSVEGRERAWRENLRDQADRVGDRTDGVWTVVAETEAGVVGFCTVAGPSRDADAGERTGEIAALYVDPTRWGRGVGRALTETGLGELGEAGFGEVTVWTLSGNARAETFYRGFGFVRDGAEQVHARSGVSEQRLRRPAGRA